MTEVGRFFDAVSYTEADQAEVQARMWRDGVIAGVGNALNVTVGGGIANVDTGEAFVQGFWYKNTTSKPLAIPTNASATPRIDLVVLALDRTGNSLIAVLHVGVVGAGAPALTQVVGGQWEMAIASISTASNVSTLTDVRVYQSNMFNPMTTADDIIIADVHGNPIRKAKGANSRVLGVSAAGVLDYRQLVAGDIPNSLITPAMLASGTASRLFGTDVSGNPALRQLLAGDVPANLVNNSMMGIGTNGIARLALDYNMSTNLSWLNGINYSTGGTMTIALDQSFTIRGTGSILICIVNAAMQVYTTGVSNYGYLQYRFDGNPFSQMGWGQGFTQIANSAPFNPFTAGVFAITNQAAGTHSIGSAIVMNSNTTLYLRPQSFGGEWYRMQVVEIMAN